MQSRCQTAPENPRPTKIFYPLANTRLGRTKENPRKYMMRSKNCGHYPPDYSAARKESEMLQLKEVRERPGPAKYLATR